MPKYPPKMHHLPKKKSVKLLKLLENRQKFPTKAQNPPTKKQFYQNNKTFGLQLTKAPKFYITIGRKVIHFSRSGLYRGMFYNIRPEVCTEVCDQILVQRSVQRYVGK